MENKAGQGIIRRRGVVLRRNDSAEGNRSVYVILEDEGPVWLLAPGAARGKIRFGGATDPFVWGNFHVYRGPNRWYLRDVDVRKDFLSLRSSPGKIRQAVGWAGSLIRHTLPGHPCNDLLPVFFWSLSLLEVPAVREDLSGWRFYWRWLRSWGLAPELDKCHSCGALLSGALFSGEALLCEKCGKNKPGFRLDKNDRNALSCAASLGHEEFLRHAGLLTIQPEKVISCTRILEIALEEKT